MKGVTSSRSLQASTDKIVMCSRVHTVNHGNAVHGETASWDEEEGAHTALAGR